MGLTLTSARVHNNNILLPRPANTKIGTEAQAVGNHIPMGCKDDMNPRRVYGSKTI